MKPPLPKLITLFCLILFMNANAQSPAQRQTAQSFVSTTAFPGTTFGYLEYLPENYASGSDFPVVIFLHGVGEKGNGTTDLYKVKTYGPPHLIDTGTNFGFVCISPQTDWPYNFVPSVISDVIDMVKSRYKINTNRIYLTGISFGGEAVWTYGSSSTDNVNKLAAMVPIAGWMTYPQGACNMNKIPIWAFQGQLDGSGTINAVYNVNNCNPAPNPAPKLTVYPGVGHDAWTQAYNDPNLWSWILAQSKTSPVINIPPTVSISSPLNNASIFAGTPVVISANASDEDGRVTKVDFYSGNTLLGSNNKSPYTFTWNNNILGNYTLTAIATDDAGAQDTSSAVSISIVPIVITTTNLAKNKPVTVSSYYYTGTEGSKAVDDNTTTNWNSSPLDPLPYITVDLGDDYFINSVVLRHAQVRGADKEFNSVDYKIEYSSDGASWIQLISVTGNSSSVTGYNVGIAGIRYFKTTISKTAVWPGKAAQIVEYQVYGSSDGARIGAPDEQFVTGKLSIYPNPSTNGQITVVLPSTQESAQVVVFDAWGNQVFKIESSDPASEYKISLPGLSSGIYFLKENISKSTATFVIK